MKIRFSLQLKGILYAFKNDYTYRLFGFQHLNNKLMFKPNWLTFEKVEKGE